MPRPALRTQLEHWKLLKILVAHNAYQHNGGEDSVMEAEIALLCNHGHSVELFRRHNDSIHNMSRSSAVSQTLWSTQTEQEFDALLRSFKPNVVHVHNTFPLISPSIYWVANRLGVPIVQTLHNFRLLCPQASFLRGGQICEDCLGKVPWRGAAHACYRDSRLQSSVVVSMVMLHRIIGTWQNKVTRYIALNEFCRNKFIQGGLPAARIVIKPNFVDAAAPVEGVRAGFLFVGRLSAEKGVDVLVDAANICGTSVIRVAGGGPQAGLLENVPGVTRLGALSSDSVRTEMSQAMALILPSICYEGFPMTLVEAFSSSLPVIASRLGSLPELVSDGVTGILFDPGNANDLANKLAWALQHPGEMAQMGRNARARYEAEFTAERNYQQLMAIYADAIDAVKSDTP
jgi:glycosyltransferase involved in cell wall biosynthesis